MRILRKVQRLCVSMVLGALLCAGAGCSCAEDEYDAVDSCDKVVEAVNAVLTQAQRPTQSRDTICGETCSSLSSCRPKIDTEACVSLIQKMPAADVELDLYRGSAECSIVLSEMVSSCSSSSSSSDFDD